MDNFEKLKENLPEIAKIVITFPEPLQGKVYETLISELLGKRADIGITGSKKDKVNPDTHVDVDDNLDAIATLTSDGQYHSSIRDLKASNAKDATKRLVYVIIQSYTKMMNSPSVSRKAIINPELIRWRLANGNSRDFIAKDMGIIKHGDKLSLDQHAQNEADQFIRDIENPEIIGSWKPGITKRQPRSKNGSENSEESQPASAPTRVEGRKKIPVSSNEIPQPHTLDEIKTTSTIAQILNAKTEDDLILAAAMKFDLIDEKKTFNRAEILKEMQTATSFYSASYLNNATRQLKSLVKREGKLRENAPGIYALSSNTRTELRRKLGLD